MFNDLTSLGYGLVVFAIIVGVGSIVLFNFSGSVATCDSTFGYVFNYSSGLCSNHTGTVAGNDSATATPLGTGYVNTNYLLGQLGTSGLAGWTPAIIAITVGLLFLGAFMIRGGRKGRY